VTHLHSDHTAGLPDLLFTPWTAGRAEPLVAFGPPGFGAMTRAVSAAWAADLDIRRRGLQPATDHGADIVAREIRAGDVYRDDHVRVSAFAVRHEAWDAAFGYRFEARDRVVVVSGDTAPADSVVAACDGCDVLVHEVFSAAGLARRSAPWQAYHRAAHTSAVDLGRLAARARPRLLVLTHVLAFGEPVESLVEEVRRGFDGPVVVGRDLAAY
jgi:ribonuclease Z